MARPANLALWWADALYSPEVQAKIDQCFAADPALLALVGRKHPRYAGPDQLPRSVVGSLGCESLYRSSGLGRVERSRHGMRFPHEGHHYLSRVYHCDEMKTQWIMFRHRNMVIVLPGRASDRRRKSSIEKWGVAIMERPTSNHARASLMQRFSTIAGEAAGLIRYVWKDGIRLHDREGYLPVGEIVLA